MTLLIYILSSFLKKIKTLWKILQYVSGNDSYERYKMNLLTKPGRKALTKKEFYLQYQEKKWSGTNKCC